MNEWVAAPLSIRAWALSSVWVALVVCARKQNAVDIACPGAEDRFPVCFPCSGIHQSRVKHCTLLCVRYMRLEHTVKAATSCQIAR